MERVLTVEFGPSRSKRFPRAVADAESGPGECSELEPGTYRVRFVLGNDPDVYKALARLLQRVRSWRATEVYEADQLVSTYHAREMAWCASSQLGWFGECRVRFFYGVPPRCSLCPLFEVERAVLDVLGSLLAAAPEGGGRGRSPSRRASALGRSLRSCQAAANSSSVARITALVDRGAQPELAWVLLIGAQRPYRLDEPLRAHYKGIIALSCRQQPAAERCRIFGRSRQASHLDRRRILVGVALSSSSWRGAKMRASAYSRSSLRFFT